jgi:hypothetical protein
MTGHCRRSQSGEMVENSESGRGGDGDKKRNVKTLLCCVESDPFECIFSIRIWI